MQISAKLAIHEYIGDDDFKSFEQNEILSIFFK